MLSLDKPLSPQVVATPLRSILRKAVCLFASFLCLQVTLANSSRATNLASNPIPGYAVRATAKTPTLVRSTRGTTPLWPGARFTERDRARSLLRGLRFIYRTALNRRNFTDHGSDYLWCFYTLSASGGDEVLQQTARRMGLERARAWRRSHRTLPTYADVETIMDYAFGSDAADSLGIRDEELKEQIRRAAPRHSAREYLQFDPNTEAPPNDVPDECEFDGTLNGRGARFCVRCKRPLVMRSTYDVWYDALITTYTGEHYGVRLGARYLDVLKWLPAMRPYRGNSKVNNEEFIDEIYAVTHIVYTLDNYSQYKLSRALLPQEFQFLQSNLRVAVADKDSDMLGEMMDALRAFGVNSDTRDMRNAINYYLSHQNRDGSWGYTDEEDIYERYHPTWNAIAGLSEYQQQAGEGLSFPEARPLLELWNRKIAGDFGLRQR